MQSERNVSAAQYESFARALIRTREEIAKELSAPCGRFKSTADIEDALRTYIFEHLRSIDPVSDEQLFAGSGFPLNWQALLNFLFEKKIIAQPRFQTAPIANDRPKITNFGLSFDPSRQTDGRSVSTMGFGGSFSPEEAMSKAIGETLERYFSSIYSDASLIQASASSLLAKRRTALDISTLNTYLPWQKSAFPEFDVDEDTPLKWVTGEAYPSGKRVLLPAQLVFWNYDHGHIASKPEKALLRPTTSGCAGHFSKDEAVLAGLLEHIQRDGFLIFWLNHIAPPILDVQSLKDTEIDEVIAYAARYRLDMKFVNTTSDINIPSVTCIVTDPTDTEDHQIAVGSSTGFDLKENIIHSAVEALVVSAHSGTLPPYALSEDYKPFSDKQIGRKERLSMWRGLKMSREFAFFTSGRMQDPRELIKATPQNLTVKEQLAYVLAQFEQHGAGYEVFVYEHHHEVLRTLGYHVVRTIVPQLLPLYLSEYAATLDSKRLKEVPAKLGYAAADTLNPWPHPFP